MADGATATAARAAEAAAAVSGTVLAPAVEAASRAGVGLAAVAERVGVGVRTLQRWLAADDRRGEVLRAARRRGEAARLRERLAELELEESDGDGDGDDGARGA